MWAYNETFYQIYPIGFCGAPVHDDGVTAHRILKVGEWAEYLQEHGFVDAVVPRLQMRDTLAQLLRLHEKGGRP